jgi:hypothetical protein
MPTYSGLTRARSSACMKIGLFRRGLLAATAAMLMTTAANAALFTASGSDADGALNGTANITVTSGLVTVVLTDTGTGEISSGQTISDVTFNVGGITAINIPSFTQSGSLININDDGTETPVAGSPTHWVPTLIGTNIHLTTLSGMQPFDLIVGSNPSQNQGFDNFNPYINQTGTFTLGCTGCTSSSDIFGVSISFGTNGFVVDADPTAAIPESSTWAMMILGFVGLGLMTYRRRGASATFRWA